MSQLRGRCPHCDGYYCDNLGGCPKAPTTNVETYATSQDAMDLRIAGAIHFSHRDKAKSGTGVGFYGSKPVEVDLSKAKADPQAYQSITVPMPYQVSKPMKWRVTWVKADGTTEETEIEA